jgi:hypothetical protein
MSINIDMVHDLYAIETRQGDQDWQGFGMFVK